MKYHNKELDEKLVKILKETFKTNEINSEDTMEQIPAWDSMKHLEIIIQLEQVFNITINEGEVVGLISLGKIIELVKKSWK